MDPFHASRSSRRKKDSGSLRRFVKFLAGDDPNSTSSGTYHSIWATPAPESGSRAVVTPTPYPDSMKKGKGKLETLSLEKSKSKMHILGMNQGTIAELNDSPTTSRATSTSMPSTAPAEPAELSATEARIAEMDADAWVDPLGSRRRGWRTVVNVKTGKVERTEFETSEAEDKNEEEDAGKGKGKEQEVETRGIEEPTPPTLKTKPQPEPEPEPTHKPEAELDPSLLIFQDETDAIPVFGRPFGIASTSIIREPNTKKPEPPKAKSAEPASANNLETLFGEVDKELDALLMSRMQQRKSDHEPKKKVKVKKHSRFKSKSKPAPEACIICLEPFGRDGVKAPDKLSEACQHPSGVCYGCLAKSIKHDLETKFWDEIKCPECKTLFTHEDIRRFADQETFTRYDKISFRHAVNADKNFIWCLECDFGQLHEPGTTQPVVKCLNCAAESCFKHAVKWHDGFTCDEYDAVLWDPDSYQTLRDTAGSSDSKVHHMSKKEITRAAKAERSRQAKLHEALKEAAKKKQKEEAKRVREEKKIQAIQAEAEAAAQEEEAGTFLDDVGTDESYREEVKDDFKEKIEMLKKRMKEVELSVQKVEQTTKRCPGCQWPIEKNDGCDHMTCIKCRREFCWICLDNWQTHTQRCRS